MRKKFLFFTLACLVVLIIGTLALLTLQVLYTKNIPILYPKGIIALQERGLFFIGTALMLIVVFPVFIFTFVFAWRYRAGNTKAKYMPDWHDNKFAEVVWWGLPCLIILLLAIITWQSSHALDPYRPIESDKKPLTIQVVALQWKWLFIYPEQQIATVNFFQFPVETPISFEITADAPMNSFWIPRLSGQIFAMPAMRTKLHIIANDVGDFRGSSANISGKGFAGMHFIAKASSQKDFDQWVESARGSPNSLSLDDYIQLAAPSENNSVEKYQLQKENLFDWILMKYM